MDPLSRVAGWLTKNERVARLRDALLPFVVLGVLLAALLYVYPRVHPSAGSHQPGDEYHEVFDQITVLLAFMALFFGFVQYKDARRHTRKMEDIAKSMSTRYVGAFPKDVEDISEVVSKTDHDFVVIADFVSYGNYAKPAGFERFIQEINAAKSRGVKVRIFVYDESPSTKALEQRFPKEKWTDECNSDRFKAFFSFYPGMSCPVSHEEFLNMFRRQERDVRSRLTDKGVNVYLLSSQERLFFWLGDDKDAVFSFESTSGGDPLCFRTRDGRMIETFQRILRPYVASAPSFLQTKKAAKGPTLQPKVPKVPDIDRLPIHSLQPNVPESKSG